MHAPFIPFGFPVLAVLSALTHAPFAAVICLVLAIIFFCWMVIGPLFSRDGIRELGGYLWVVGVYIVLPTAVLWLVSLLVNRLQ